MSRMTFECLFNTSCGRKWESEKSWLLVHVLTLTCNARRKSLGAPSASHAPYVSQRVGGMTPVAQTAKNFYLPWTAGSRRAVNANSRKTLWGAISKADDAHSVGTGKSPESQLPRRAYILFDRQNKSLRQSTHCWCKWPTCLQYWKGRGAGFPTKREARWPFRTLNHRLPQTHSARRSGCLPTI